MKSLSGYCRTYAITTLSFLVSSLGKNWRGIQGETGGKV
jgi:hypothetical protein